MFSYFLFEGLFCSLTPHVWLTTWEPWFGREGGCLSKRERERNGPMACGAATYRGRKDQEPAGQKSAVGSLGIWGRNNSTLLRRIRLAIWQLLPYVGGHCRGNWHLHSWFFGKKAFVVFPSIWVNSLFHTWDCVILPVLLLHLLIFERRAEE